MGDEGNLELSELEETASAGESEDGAGNGDGIDPNAMMDSDLPRNSKDLEAVYDIPVQVSAVLGKASMQVSQLLKLGRGAVVELDRKVGEAIDIYVNNRLVAGAKSSSSKTVWALP